MHGLSVFYLYPPNTMTNGFTSRRIYPSYARCMAVCFLIVFCVAWAARTIAEAKTAHHALSFGEVRDGRIVLPEPRPRIVGEKKILLAHACGNDDRCVCVNDAIFKHDSSWATAGIGARINNPCNMRVPSTWKPSVPFTVYRARGNGVFSRFETLQDGVTACVELYARNYKHLPPDTLVSIWTDGGGNRAYRAAVSSCYL